MERVQHSCKSTESRPSLKSDRARNQESNELQASEWRENCSVDALPVTCHMTYIGTCDIWNQLGEVSMVWWDHNWDFWLRFLFLHHHTTSLCQGFLWEGPEGLLNTFFIACTAYKKHVKLCVLQMARKQEFGSPKKGISIKCTSLFTLCFTLFCISNGLSCYVERHSLDRLSMPMALHLSTYLYETDSLHCTKTRDKQMKTKTNKVVYIHSDTAPLTFRAAGNL